MASGDDTFAGLEVGETKTIQLCRQVEEAIAYALACAANPILRDLHVVGVEPLRGAALLRVRVADEAGLHEVDEAADALRRAEGYFRREVAQAIHRKRVPTLDIVLLPGDEAWTAAGESEDRT